LSFTYNISVSGDIDKVRFNTGDVNSADYNLENEEIVYLLSIYSVNEASIQACYNIMSKLASSVDETLDGHSKSYSQKQEHYKNIIKNLRSRSSSQISFPVSSSNDAVFTREKP